MVEDWGIGKPDFVSITSPTRTEVQVNGQMEWNMLIQDFVYPANYTLTVPAAYTIPANYTLVVGYIKSSYSIDGIFPSTITKNGVPFCSLFHNQLTIVALPDTSGWQFDAGDYLGFIFENTLDVPLVGRSDMSGFLYKV